MTIEVIAREFGVLRARDVREVPLSERQVRALVLSVDGLPFMGPVVLGQKPSGRGVHRALVCPGCGKPKLQLVIDGTELRCGRCARRLPRRAAERTLRSYTRLGGALEDVLLRGVVRKNSSAAIDRLTKVAAEMREADDARWAALVPDIEAALLLAHVSYDFDAEGGELEDQGINQEEGDA